MSAYFNLRYGMFRVLLGEQKRRMRVAFNTVIKRIFKLSKYTDVIVYIDSKPYDIILDERRFLLLQSLQSPRGAKRKCEHVVSHSKDVMRIIMEYSVSFILSAGYVRR